MTLQSDLKTIREHFRLCKRLGFCRIVVKRGSNEYACEADGESTEQLEPAVGGGIGFSLDSEEEFEDE